MRAGGTKERQGRDRREELIDAAWQLFSERGYEKASVNDVIDAAGVAKGTFYHYFPSKSELLDAVTERLIRQGMGVLDSVVEDDSLSGLDKFNKLLQWTNSWKAEQLEVTLEVARAMFRDENLLFRERTKNRTITMITPYWEKIIAQGTQERDFNTAYPREAAEAILSLSVELRTLTIQDILTIYSRPDKAKRIKQRTAFMFDAIEKILGAKQGSIKGAQGKGLDQTIARALELAERRMG